MSAEQSTYRAYCRTVTTPRVDAMPAPTKFGEAITADHKILNYFDKSRDHDRAALIVKTKQPTGYKDTQPLRRAAKRPKWL